MVVSGVFFPGGAEGLQEENLGGKPKGREFSWCVAVVGGRYM